MISNKSRLVALLLNIFLGMLGIHRMYVGKFLTGIIQFILTVTFAGIWISAVWVFVDLLMIAVGGFKDAQGRYVYKWE